MARLQLISHSSISEAVTLLIDDLCIKCDKAHSGRCISFSDWQQSERFQQCRHMSLAAMVDYVRRDRAKKVMGG